MRSHQVGTRRTGRRVAVMAAATATTAVLLTAGCSSSDTTTTTTTAASASSGTKAPETSTTAKTGGTTPGTAKTNSTAPKGSTVDLANADILADEDAVDVTWSLDAGEYRGRDGWMVAYDCSPDGETSTVWGDGVYTDDSSVCVAAVHAGLIDFADGGRVVIEISPGLEEYGSSTANGVTTTEYGSWGGSYSFPGN